MTAGPAGDAAARRPVPSPLLTIGEVLAELQLDFPDVSHSKLRFLEERGLVSPQRTPSGYRKFSPADVERLRFVLSLQRDRYLPLRVIGAYLAAVDRGAEPPALPGGPVRPPRRVDAAAGEGREEQAAPTGAARGRAARADLVALAGGDGRLVEALEEHGLLARSPAGTYPADAADVVRCARELAEHGIEPRHLRPLRTAAEREAALVEQVVSPLRRQQRGGAGARAEEVGREIAGSLLRLHESLLRSALEGPRG
ncbi:MerR family transcriptional regulator [Quadrisphaera sp. DSM 44207]|uniref:transcriptional regulator FtsR n=1 Tax=Quadrisphaera sp. DSM 44207 TaxID=1881057 RepID=UPI00088A9BDC|nr:MerR family transcriptional regulator [Quadrisphaera sp. DSM 44207]SDQ39318.1 MerR family regulatory protein [Quadrisphaera sp. DSM 44207]